MGTFSPAHWIIAIALMAGAASLIYFVGSLMWAGAKASGSKWKLIAVALLIPVAILAVIGFIGASKTPVQEQQRAIKSPNAELKFDPSTARLAE